MCVLSIFELNGAPHTWTKNVYFGHKILMKSSHDCSSKPEGERPNGVLLEETGRNLESPLGAPRATEQPRRPGTSARCVYDPITQGYRPKAVVDHGVQCPGTLFVISFEVTVITLRAPLSPHTFRAGSVQEAEISGTCAYMHNP